MHVVDRERRIRVVHGDNLLAGQIARTVIQMEKIAEGQPQMAAAWRAIDRIAHADLPVERQIPGRESEGLPTAAARNHDQWTASR